MWKEEQRNSVSLSCFSSPHDQLSCFHSASWQTSGVNASSLCVLGTPLQLCTYASLTADLQARSREVKPFTVDFTNTHIVTMRRRDAEFRELTSRMDYFIPDGMPLIWCLNRQHANLRDRVYGPTFMRDCVLGSPGPFTHYFLGGNDECVSRLQAFFLKENPKIQIVGARNGYFKAEDEPQILDEINRLSPDFIWIGLGTPKQQAWVHKYKSQIRRGIVLAVGFAFDVNAGMLTACRANTAELNPRISAAISLGGVGAAVRTEARKNATACRPIPHFAAGAVTACSSPRLCLD